jgi:hypothetical protein
MFVKVNKVTRALGGKFPLFPFFTVNYFQMCRTISLTCCDTLGDSVGFLGAYFWVIIVSHF